MSELTKTQMAALLAVCSRFDGRTLDEVTFDAWHSLLADLPYEDIEDAIRTHYRTDRRWIMPADIVAHHERLQAARDLERTYRNPPACLGCGLPYALSGLEGSEFALPQGEHDPGCKAMQGVLRFDDGNGGRWLIMPLDVATFDEAAWMAGWLQMRADAASRRRLNPDSDADPLAIEPSDPDDLEAARRLLDRDRRRFGEQ